MGHFAGFFKCAETFGVKNVEAPSKKPKYAPVYVCFAPDKKIISRTFKSRGALVFLCPKERERERERGGERERE
jgi:hypothetical protein